MADASNLASHAVEGEAAHDAAVVGNPLLDGGEARTTLPAAVADGDAVRRMHDDLGRAVMTPFVPRDLITHNTITLSTTAETTLIAAGGAGVFRDLVLLVVSNTSGADVRIDIRDATLGTIRWSFMVAGSGGGAVIKFPVPLTQAIANNNWTATLGAAVTDVRVNAVAIDQN